MDAQLLKTTDAGRGRGVHSHIAYLRADGTGITTESAGHSHDIVYQQEQMAMLDEDPNSPTFGQQIGGGMQAGWYVTEVNGHTHELTEYPVKEDGNEKKSDADIVREVLSDFAEDKEREKESRTAGAESENMYAHRQWDEAAKKKLQSEDRAAHTINSIEEKIDTLCGYQRQNRTDIKYLPTENGDAVVADILNIVTKNILENCVYQREETKVFEDCSITGRGLFNIFDDFTKSVQGDIVVERFAWDECYFGPHDKEDLSDCERLEKTKWYSPERLKQEWPEKFDQLSPEMKFVDATGGPSEDWDKRIGKSELYDGKNYRLIEQEKRIYKRVYILVNSEDGFTFNAEGWSETDVNAVKALGFAKIPRVTSRMKVRKIVSTVLLEDEYSDDDDFSIVPLYAKYRNNEFWGKVEGVKDLQLLLNKAYSQFSDIINKCANYGWFYDSETFSDKVEEAKWRANAAKPGFVQKLNNIEKPPQKVDGVQFPRELVEAIGIFSTTMRQIMNINMEMQGLTGENQSGVAMRQKITQQLLGNDFLFDNLSFSKKQIGRILVKKIQKLYTPERIVRILRNEKARNPELEIAGKPIAEYDPQAIEDMLRKQDLTTYDVIVSESASSPSAMMSNFLLMLELASKGVQIPPAAILEFAPIPQKEKIQQMIAQQVQQQADMEKMKYETEIKKSLIAKAGDVQAPPPGGLMPPAMAGAM